MKKIIFLMLTSFLIIGFVIYHSFSKQSLASNNPIEEEYYYNEIVYIDEVVMPDINKSTDELNKDEDIQEHVYEHMIKEVDTVPDSLTVLINKEFSLPSDYVPKNLTAPAITFSFRGYHEKKLMRQDAAKSLEELVEAASCKGLRINGVSGYRSYRRQLNIYNKNIMKNGLEYTNKYSAKAGYSEHQSGLAMDVSTNSIRNRLDVSFADTKEGKWLKENCWKFGYIIRYPEGKSHITGYAYEPWHIRYVGNELAKYLTENELTMEEYYGYVPSEALQEDETYGIMTDLEGE